MSLRQMLLVVRPVAVSSLLLFWTHAVHSEKMTNYQMASGETSAGVIEVIGEDGSLKLSNGATIQIWGLVVTDRQLAEKLLIGLTARCGMLPNTFNYRVGDCTVYMPDDSGTFGLSIEHDVPGVPLDLFIWLPRFGVAQAVCTDTTRATDQVTHTWRKYRYICDEAGQPRRKFQGLEPLK